MAQPTDYENIHDGTRLDKDAEEKLVQRLYYRQMEIAEQRARDREDALQRARDEKRKTIPKSEEERLVQRIYDQQIEHFEMTRTQQEKKKEEEMHRNDRTLSSSELEDHIRRMYDDEIERSRRTHEQLESRYMPTQEPKKISKQELGECVSRLYNVDWEKRDEELFKKHVYPNDPKSAKISRSDVQAMADRLSTTKGAA